MLSDMTLKGWYHAIDLFYLFNVLSTFKNGLYKLEGNNKQFPSIISILFTIYYYYLKFILYYGLLSQTRHLKKTDDFC